MNIEHRYRRSGLGAATLIITTLVIYVCYRFLQFHGVDVHRLIATDGNPHSITVVSILAYSLVFGLKHALEPDHLAAVSTIAVEHKSLIGSSLVGAIWGLGHTLSLLIAGLVVILLGFNLREEYLTPVEIVVAMMLIGLGARALWKLRQEKDSVNAGQSEVIDHSHAVGNSSSSIWERIGFRPLLIGMIHGLAGSAALLLLLIPIIPSTALKLIYILVFGVGSITGMVIMSCMVGLPTRLMAVRYLKLNFAVRALAALFSLGFGIWMLHKFMFM